MQHVPKPKLTVTKSQLKLDVVTLQVIAHINQFGGDLEYDSPSWDISIIVAPKCLSNFKIYLFSSPVKIK